MSCLRVQILEKKKKVNWSVYYLDRKIVLFTSKSHWSVGLFDNVSKHNVIHAKISNFSTKNCFICFLYQVHLKYIVSKNFSVGRIIECSIYKTNSFPTWSDFFKWQFGVLFCTGVLNWWFLSTILYCHRIFFFVYFLLLFHVAWKKISWQNNKFSVGFLLNFFLINISSIE